IERIRQIVRDRSRVTAFDLMALQHIGNLAVLKNSHRWRRRKVSLEIATRAFGCGNIAAGKDGNDIVRLYWMLACLADSGKRESGRASADGVHHDHHRALRVANHLV